MLPCVYNIIRSQCPSGGTGRRPGLKIPWEQSRAGSIPASGTMKKARESVLFSMISVYSKRMIYLWYDIPLSGDEIRLRRMKNGYYIIHARSGVYII